jgi:hypothetical protein
MVQYGQLAFAKAKAGATNPRKSLISMIVSDNSTSPTRYQMLEAQGLRLEMGAKNQPATAHTDEATR